MAPSCTGTKLPDLDVIRRDPEGSLAELLDIQVRMTKQAEADAAYMAKANAEMLAQVLYTPGFRGYFALTLPIAAVDAFCRGVEEQSFSGSAALADAIRSVIKYLHPKLNHFIDYATSKTQIAFNISKVVVYRNGIKILATSDNNTLSKSVASDLFPALKKIGDGMDHPLIEDVAFGGQQNGLFVTTQFNTSEIDLIASKSAEDDKRSASEQFETGAIMGMQLASMVPHVECEILMTPDQVSGFRSEVVPTKLYPIDGRRVHVTIDSLSCALPINHGIS